MWEIGEAILWFLLSIVITTAGVLAALFAMLIYYFRGTRAGGFAMTCVIFSVLAAAVLWVIFVAVDPPAAMIFAAVMSIAAFMSFASWLARYDRS
jgi:hypothetical protein